MPACDRLDNETPRCHHATNGLWERRASVRDLRSAACPPSPLMERQRPARTKTAACKGRQSQSTGPLDRVVRHSPQAFVRPDKKALLGRRQGRPRKAAEISGLYRFATKESE